MCILPTQCILEEQFSRGNCGDRIHQRQVHRIQYLRVQHWTRAKGVFFSPSILIFYRQYTHTDCRVSSWNTAGCKTVIRWQQCGEPWGWCSLCAGLWADQNLLQLHHRIHQQYWRVCLKATIHQATFRQFVAYNYCRQWIAWKFPGVWVALRVNVSALIWVIMWRVTWCNIIYM